MTRTCGACIYSRLKGKITSSMVECIKKVFHGLINKHALAPDTCSNFKPR